MPELPEVETYRRYLERCSLGKIIRDVRVTDPKNFPGFTPQQVRQRLAGRRIAAAGRRGKYLIVSLDGRRQERSAATGGVVIVIHFGMTGDLVFTRSNRPIPYSRTAFDFAHGTLHYVNMRRFGGIWLVDSLDDFPRVNMLGPDPISGMPEADSLKARLSRSSQPIKQALMNQKLVAGIGNLYADEILFQSRLNPRRRPSSLNREQWRILHRSMKQVLSEAIRLRSDLDKFPKRFLLPHRFGDRRCPRCARDLKSITQGQRTTYFCSRCQK